jgi:hypothetical protein
MCKAYSAWALDDSPPDPILKLPKTKYKFNSKIIATPDWLESQKECSNIRIKGFKNRFRER